MAPPPSKGKKRAAEDSSKPAFKKSKPTTEKAPVQPQQPRTIPTTATQGPPTLPYKSSLVQDDVDFPRGGGSALTPFEFKEATNEARKEADADARVEDSAAAAEKAKLKGKQREGAAPGGKKSKAAAASSASAGVDSETFRVEHLNYKRLSIGTPLFGRIHSIHPLHLVVSLPNQMFAHVPITQISQALTTRLNALSPSDDGEESEDEEEDVPSLEVFFKVGQYVRANVTALHLVGTSSPAALEGWKPRDEMERSCRRVELTLDPKTVNEGIKKVDLEEGFCLSAAVQSIEDHGYILDFGMPDLQGFLSFKDVKEFTPNSISKDGRHLQVGQLIDTCVLKMAENKRTCTFTVSATKLATSSLTNVSSITSLLPGTLVQALITAVVPGSGLNLKLLGFFDGTVDSFHIPPQQADDIANSYKIGKKIKARITYLTTSAADQTQRFGLSLLPHVLALGDQTPPEGSGAESMEEFAEIGTVFERVTVVRVESEWGLVVDVDDGVRGYVHISQLADEHTATLSGTTGPFKVGSTHKARVVGMASLDGLIQLSFKPSVLEKKFMKVSEVVVGEIMKGTIKRLTSNGLFIDLHGSVDGVVWPLHYADIKLKNPERRFKVGTVVKCRILTAEPEKGRVSITLKKTLVDSDLPIVASFEDAQVDTITDGVVSRFLDKGMLVDMYGGIRAFVPVGEASDTFIQSLDTSFFIGKPVKIKIINADPSTNRLVASIRQALPGSKGPSASSVLVSTSDVEIGNIVEGTIFALHKAHILVTLAPSQAKALLSKSNLAHHRGIPVDELSNSVQLGEKLTDLVVVAKDDEKSLLIVANKPKKETVSTKAPPSGISQPSISFDSIVVGEVVPGRVVSHGPQGANIQISKSLRGRVHLTDSSDDFKKGTALPEVGAIVKCVVLKVEALTKRIDLSTRQSRVNPSSKAKVVDREIESVEGLEVGQQVRGFVKGITDGGLFVSLGRDVTARVMIKDLFDEFVKEWKPRFELGQVVEGKISSVNIDRNQVELTFRTKAAPEPRVKNLSYGNFEVGQKVDAIVKRVETFGIFLRIDDTTISGLCHKSELSDDATSDVGKALKGFREGDTVKAVILTLDAEARKISFGIKPSYFVDEDFQDEDDEEEEEGSDEEEEESDVEMVDGSEEEAAEVAGGDEAEESDEEVVMFADEDTPKATSSKSKASKASTSTAGSTLMLSGGFSWSAKDGSDDEDESDSDDDTPAPTVDASKSKKQKKSIQQDLTADLQSRAPESTGDFERLLLGSPNSSFLWIQYMSFQLQISEVGKARDIGHRALKTINFREEGEKLNVWIALLNLENTFGTEDTTELLFKRAIQFNDPETVHLRMADIYEKTEKFEKAEETYKRALKKFGQSSQVWTSFGEYYLNRDNAEAARELLPRSLKSLPKSEHIKTISKFAQLEFKHGDAERGKTIFEGIIDSYPKRLDLWTVYIDMEVKQGDIQSVRNLFERVLTQKLAMKKAKALFKKWMGLERRLALPGDDSGAEMVKAKAIAFVQKAASASAGGAGGDEEMEE